MADEPATKIELDRMEAHFRELLTAERDARQTQQTTNKEALDLQAKEYGRRLDELNHAHATALEVQSKTVTREMFDQYRESQAKEQASFEHEIQTFKDSVNRFITQETTKSMEYAGQSARSWAVGMLILSVIATVILHFIFPATTAFPK